MILIFCPAGQHSDMRGKPSPKRPRGTHIPNESVYYFYSIYFYLSLRAGIANSENTLSSMRTRTRRRGTTLRQTRYRRTPCRSARKASDVALLRVLGLRAVTQLGRRSIGTVTIARLVVRPPRVCPRFGFTYVYNVSCGVARM